MTEKINLERLRKFGVTVERKVGQDQTEPAPELKEVEKSQLVNFVFSVRRPDGKVENVPKRDIPFMSKAD